MSVEQAQGRGAAPSPLHSIFWFASSNVFRQVVNAGATMLRPALLSPEMFGLFSALRLLPTYSLYLHLGALHGMRYMIPVHEARGEQDEVARLKATVFMGALILNLIVVAGILVLVLCMDWSMEVRIGLLICAATMLLGCVFEHFLTEMKAHQMFRSVSINTCVGALVYLVTGIALVVWLGFYGALLSDLIATAVMIAIIGAGGMLQFRRGFSFSLFKAAVVLGGPSLLFDAAVLMMRTTDRLIITYALDYEQLGYYGLGAMVMGYVMHIPGATREVMEVDLFYNRDKLLLQDVFQKYVARPMIMVGLSMIFVIGPMVLVLPFIISLLLPAYTEGVLAAQVLMLGGYFMAIAFPIRGILAAYGWQRWGALILLGAIVLHAGVSLVLIKLELGIVGVALSAGICFFFAAMALLLFVIFKLPVRPQGWSLSILRILMPFPLMLGMLYAATELGAWLHWSPWATLFVQLFIFGLVLASGVLVAERTGMIRLRRMLAGRDHGGVVIKDA